MMNLTSCTFGLFTGVAGYVGNYVDVSISQTRFVTNENTNEFSVALAEVGGNVNVLLDNIEAFKCGLNIGDGNVHGVVTTKITGTNAFSFINCGMNATQSILYLSGSLSITDVIMKYFNIDSETLQSKTIYDSENLTYEYKPRGFEEVEYPEYPYSEVVGFTENNDGTITLTANVVFPYAGDSKVYAHEVVVRPLENGRVQYVSNRIIPSEDNYRETWHTPRLTLEEWEELYGGE